VLNGSQVHWTTDAENGIKMGAAGIQKFVDFLQAQLLDTVGLVRQKLTKLQSITLGALIVIDVHAMDVVSELFNSKCEDINSFEWISQLRYYWEDDNCRVKCI
jgi:dynein heavy chain